VSRVLRPARHITGHFGDESLQLGNLLHWYRQQETEERNSMVVTITFNIVEVEQYLSNDDASVKKNDYAQKNLDRVALNESWIHT